MVTGCNQCCNIYQRTAQDADNPDKHANIFIQKRILVAELTVAHTQTQWCTATAFSLVSWCLWRHFIPQRRQHPKLFTLIMDVASRMADRCKSWVLCFCTKATWIVFVRKMCFAFCSSFFLFTFVFHDLT